MQAFFAWQVPSYTISWTVLIQCRRLHSIGKDSKYMKPVPALVLVVCGCLSLSVFPFAQAFPPSAVTAAICYYDPAERRGKRSLSLESRAGLTDDHRQFQFVRSTANLNIYIPIHLSTQLVCDSLITVSMIIVVSHYDEAVGAVLWKTNPPNSYSSGRYGKERNFGRHRICWLS